MSEVIVVTSGKGGVGKTTTSANVGTGLAAMGKKVVLIDTDIGLRNLDVVMGLENRIVYNLVDVVEGNCRVKQALIKDKRYSSLYLLPSAQTRDKTSVNESQMIKLIEHLKSQFDYIILDCPPSLGLITLNALCAARELLVPLQCEFFALEGIVKLLQTYEQVKKRLNPQLNLMGVVLTMYDVRNRLSRQVKNEVRKCFPDQLFETVVPRNVRLSEAPSHGRSVIHYDVKSKGAEAYLALAKEVILRRPRG